MVQIKVWIKNHGKDTLLGVGFCVMLYIIMLATLSLTDLNINKDNPYVLLGILFSYLASVISSSVKIGRSLKENNHYEKSFSIGFFMVMSVILFINIIAFYIDTLPVYLLLIAGLLGYIIIPLMVKKDILGKTESWKKYNTILNFVADYGTFLMIIYTISFNFFIDIINQTIPPLFIFAIFVDFWFLIGMLFAYLSIKKSFEKKLKPINRLETNDIRVNFVVFVVVNILVLIVMYWLMAFFNIH